MVSKAVVHDKPAYLSSSLSPDIEGLIFRYDMSSSPIFLDNFLRHTTMLSVELIANVLVNAGEKYEESL